MVGALRGAVTCGRCGGELSSSAPGCERCGMRSLPAEPGTALGTYSGLLAGVQLAAPSRRRLALLLDALPVILLVAAGAGILAQAGIAERADLVALVLLAILAYAAAHLSWLGTRGRSLGRLLLHLRTVDDLTGEAPAAVAALLPVSRTLTADLRRGRDPLRSGASPVALVSLDPDDRRDGVPVTTGRIPLVEESPSVALVLDSGERVEVQSSLLVGRSPAVSEGEEHPLFSWPDLSRSISKTHVLFEWSGSVLWVTDLASTNGTTLVAPDGTRQPLVAGLRGAAAPGWTVRVGERTVAVHPSGVVTQ